MLLLPDKKKIATIIVGKLGGGSGGGKPPWVQGVGERSKAEAFEMPSDEDASDASAALKSAARAMLGAFDRKDEDALVSALKDFIYLCEEKDEAKESEEG